MDDTTENWTMAFGWMYAYACVAVDEGRDIRTEEFPAIVDEMKKDLAPVIERLLHACHCQQ